METFEYLVETEDGITSVKNGTGYAVGEDGVLHVLNGEDFIASFNEGKWYNIVREENESSVSEG